VKKSPLDVQNQPRLTQETFYSSSARPLGHQDLHKSKITKLIPGWTLTGFIYIDLTSSSWS
jgi:hypothetical protein